MDNTCWCSNPITPHTHVKAYLYDTGDPGKVISPVGHAIQGKIEWHHLTNLLYKLGITVFW